VFEPHVQIESGEEVNPEGKGLGLYICKQLCEEMGGSIKCKSMVNVKTVFMVAVKAEACFRNRDTVVNMEKAPSKRIHQSVRLDQITF